MGKAKAGAKPGSKNLFVAVVGLESDTPLPRRVGPTRQQLINFSFW
jgi:hypothetical protein